MQSYSVKRFSKKKVSKENSGIYLHYVIMGELKKTCSLFAWKGLLQSVKSHHKYGIVR